MRAAAPTLTPAVAMRQLDAMKAFLAARQEASVEAENLDRFEHALADLRHEREWSHAMVLAVIADEPVPVSLFRPWACRATIWRWSTQVEKDRMPTELLNGKTCVRPSDFFAALKLHGRNP